MNTIAPTPRLHKSPIQMVYEAEKIGIRPGSRTHRMTDEEFKAWQEEEEAE